MQALACDASVPRVAVMHSYNRSSTVVRSSTDPRPSSTDLSSSPLGSFGHGLDANEHQSQGVYAI